MTKKDIAINIEGLTFGYTSHSIFKDFYWGAGQPITILEGPSGCGKTTLLRILAGHLSATHASTLEAPTPARLILQDDSLFPWLTAEGNLSLVAGWSGFDAVDERLKSISSVVETYAQQIVGTMSFGQRRFLELFRVLAFPAPLLLLDEPLNFLDESRRKIVIKTIGDLTEFGYRFIISSHYETDFGHLNCERFRFSGNMPYKCLSTQVTQ